ncbi:hypothetical protein J2TS4_25750 [Paenibacillus sp. J2TS4]|nr:hypothetical protein J2TS4_25750 [Paenibacillus sp. J2TS4]
MALSTFFLWPNLEISNFQKAVKSGVIMCWLRLEKSAEQFAPEPIREPGTDRDHAASSYGIKTGLTKHTTVIRAK